MRLLVTSDSHNSPAPLEKALNENPNVDLLIHLGDGEKSLLCFKQQHPELEVVNVKGNCDKSIDSPLVQNIVIEGKKIFITHGHLYGVKEDIYNIFMAAREHNADIVLFGHTHNAFQEWNDGIYIMNPGCIDDTYGLIDITPSGIVTTIMDNKINN